MANKRKHSSSRQSGSGSTRNRVKADPSTLKATGKTADTIPEPAADPGADGNCGNGNPRCKSLVIDATKYRTHLNYKFENRRKWENPDPRKITSSIPGTIVKLYAKEGKEVKEGDQMLILEAMKMRNKILFHTGGTVKKVYVKEGEKVPKNFLMLELK